MVMQSKELVQTKEAQAKNLIMRAWRERWTDVQWGIHVRSVIINYLESIKSNIQIRL